MKATPERLEWTKKRVVELVDWLNQLYDPEYCDWLTHMDAVLGATADNTATWHLVKFDYIQARANIRELTALSHELATGEVKS